MDISMEIFIVTALTNITSHPDERHIPGTLQMLLRSGTGDSH